MQYKCQVKSYCATNSSFAFWNFLEILFFWVFLIYDLLNLLMWSPKIWRTNCSWDAESNSFWFTQSGSWYLFCLTLKYKYIINYCPRLRESDSYFVIRNKLFSDLRFFQGWVFRDLAATWSLAGRSPRQSKWVFSSSSIWIWKFTWKEMHVIAGTSAFFQKPSQPSLSIN